MKRSPEDLCFLCEERKATQTDSHIITKALLKGLKIGDGKIYSLKPFHYHIHPGPPDQDSPKHDYYFCKECESGFNKFETPYFHKMKYIPKQPSFFFGAQRIKSMGSKEEMKLFVYTQFYRASLSTHPAFSYLKLPKEEERALANLILRQPYGQEFTPFISCVTVDDEVDESNNILFCYRHKNVNYIYANKVLFRLSFDRNNLLCFGKDLITSSKELLIINCLTAMEWAQEIGVIREALLKITKYNLIEDGEQPYFMKFGT